jgi:N-acyl homoserine lactone hydrolase
MTTPFERGPVADAQRGTRLHLMRTGTIPMSPGYVFRTEAKNLPEAFGMGVPRSSKLVSPIGAFLIEHPTCGPILVDTGMHPLTATDPKKNLGPIVGAAFKGLKIDAAETVPAQLRARGVLPDDIRTVVMTHLHADHTSAMSEFPNATFVISRSEWNAARRRLGVFSGYVRGHLPPVSSVRFVDFEEGRPWEGLERTIDVLGDGTIRLVSTPGHTVDHLSVLVEGGDGPIFLLGDAVYTLRNLDEDVLPWRTADDDDSSRTMDQLRAYAESHPGVPLIPTHDADVWDQLAPASPESIG